MFTKPLKAIGDFFNEVNVGRKAGEIENIRKYLIRNMDKATMADNIKTYKIADYHGKELDYVRGLPQEQIDDLYNKLSNEQKTDIAEEITKYMSGLNKGVDNKIIFNDEVHTMPSMTLERGKETFPQNIGRAINHPHVGGIALMGTGVGAGALANEWGNETEPYLIEAVNAYDNQNLNYIDPNLIANNQYIDPNIIATEYAYTSPPLDEYMMMY